MSSGYSAEGHAQYSYEIHKIINVVFLDQDGDRKGDRVKWINQNVATIKNIEPQKKYYLQISANLDTKITIENFYYQGVTYTGFFPSDETPTESESQILEANHQNACRLGFELDPEDVGIESDLTRIRFDDQYIDIFHEQKEGLAAPEKPPEYTRIGNKIAYSWSNENNRMIQKEFTFSVEAGEVYRGLSQKPLEMHWRADGVAVIHNVKVNETAIFGIKANHETKIKFQEFSLENKEYKRKIPRDKTPNNERIQKLGEYGIFLCQVKFMLSMGEYYSGIRDLLRIWFDGRHIDVFFSTEPPPPHTATRTTYCIKCSRALKSS